MLNELEMTCSIGIDFATSYLFEYAKFLGFKNNEALKCHEFFKFYMNLENTLKRSIDEWNKGNFDVLDDNKKEVVKVRIKKIFIAFRFFVGKLNEVTNDVSKYQKKLQEILNFLEEKNILTAKEII